MENHSGLKEKRKQLISVASFFLHTIPRTPCANKYRTSVFGHCRIWRREGDSNTCAQRANGFQVFSAPRILRDNTGR